MTLKLSANIFTAINSGSSGKKITFTQCYYYDFINNGSANDIFSYSDSENCFVIFRTESTSLMPAFGKIRYSNDFIWVHSADSGTIYCYLWYGSGMQEFDRTISSYYGTWYHFE